MNAPALLRRDLIFYPALFLVWAVYLLARHGNHTYFGRPFLSASVDNAVRTDLKQRALMDASLAELIKNFTTEKDPVERRHIRHNIGTAYYDLYKESHQRNLLDSSLAYIDASVKEGPQIARFSYNLGRIYTEVGDHLQAKKQYELALEADPLHILALHNLGLLNYFELRKPAEAREYLKRALKIDEYLPIGNLVLGLVELDAKMFDGARAFFEKEIESDRRFSSSKNRYPVSVQNIRFAESLARYNLALLHSTHFVDSEKAQTHYHEFLKLEANQQRRDDLTKEMRKYWEMK